MIRFLSLLLIFTSLAQSESNCFKSEDLGFLRSLYQERQYALVAFQAEIIKRSAPCSIIPEIDLELGKALYQLGAFSRTRHILKPHLSIPDPAYRRFWAEANLLDLDSPQLLDSLQAFLALSARDSIWEKEERALLTSAILYLKGDAKEAKKIWPDQIKGRNSNPICPNSNEAQCYLDLGFQSPVTAAGLSIFPGLGYAYGGRIGDGIFALTLVSFFYGVAAYYSNYGSPVRAWTFAGFGSVFHISNIYGAFHAVEKNNKVRKTRFLMALHRKLFP